MTNLAGGGQKRFAVVRLRLSVRAEFQLGLIKSAASDQCFLIQTRYVDARREPESQTSTTDGGSWQEGKE